MNVYQRLRIAATTLGVLLVVGALLLWLPALAPVGPADSRQAADQFGRGSAMLVIGIVVLVLRHGRVRRRKAIAIASMLAVASVAPLRAEPVLERYRAPGVSEHVANGSGYGRGGGPVRAMRLANDDVRVVQFHATLELGHHDVGRTVTPS